MEWISNDAFGPCSGFQLVLGDRLLLAEDGLEATTGGYLGCATELWERAGSWRPLLVAGDSTAVGSSLSSVEPDERLFMDGEGSLESSLGGRSRWIA